MKKVPKKINSANNSFLVDGIPISALFDWFKLAAKMSVYVMFGSLNNWHTRKSSKMLLISEGVPQGCA